MWPGFAERGRAFSSSGKKPPAGLKEASWKKSKGAGVIGEPQPMGRERSEARRPGRRKFLQCGLRHDTQSYALLSKKSAGFFIAEHHSCLSKKKSAHSGITPVLRVRPTLTEPRRSAPGVAASAPLPARAGL